MRPQQEIEIVKKAADASVAVLKKFLLAEVETVIDEEKKVVRITSLLLGCCISCHD